MVTVITSGGGETERIRRSDSMALSKGVCASITITSGLAAGERRGASSSLGTSPDHFHAPMGGQHPGQPPAEHGVVVGQQHLSRTPRVGRFRSHCAPS